ncbi:CD302 antigen-like isoform X2 [Mytilus edulis]|uniref:CD302 antigen-like isoform X2 n=1 Tax=Mytilus edulis TaxID=6550 RepID=UPI0039EF2295
MKSLLFTITGILGLLLVPAIEMKRKRCHKRPTVGVANGNGFGVAEVRSFSGSLYIFVKNVLGYDDAKDFCSYKCSTLVEINNKEENRFIYSALRENGLSYPLIGLESRNGISYEWQSKNTTDSNMFNDWHPTKPDKTAVGSCAMIFLNLDKWIDIRKSCDCFSWIDIPKGVCEWESQCICELRFD